MFQVIVQYFEDRFASFFVDNPIEAYKDLLEQVRKVIPVPRQISDEDIKISYKDIQLDTFINIDPSEDCKNLHLIEAFRNYTTSGSDVNSYRRRVHLQVRETDSPFLLKKRTSRLATATARQSPNAKAELNKGGKISKCLLSTFSSVSDSFGRTVSFFQVSCKSFVKISLMVELAGTFATSHTLFSTRACCISAVDVLGFTVLQYSTNSTTSGFETVCSFQPGLPGCIDPERTNRPIRFETV